MPRLSNRKFETFNDGVLNVFKLKDRKKGELILKNLRFGNKTIGIKSYYEARVLSEEIDRKIAVPCVGKIGQMDLIEIENKQYKIYQIQEKFDAKPPCSYLTLKENKVRINAG